MEKIHNFNMISDISYMWIIPNFNNGFFKIYLFSPFPPKRLQQWESNLFLLLSSSERESIYFHIHKPFQLLRRPITQILREVAKSSQPISEPTK